MCCEVNSRKFVETWIPSRAASFPSIVASLLLGALLCYPGRLLGDDVRPLIVKSHGTFRESDDRAEIVRQHLRHVSVATQSKHPVAAVTTRDGLLIWGERRGEEAVWQAYKLRNPDGSSFVAGAINSFSLSPDGTRAFVRGNSDAFHTQLIGGRFAVVMRDDIDRSVTFEGLPLFIRFDELDNTDSQNDAIIAVLSTTTASWLDKNRRLAVGYRDGRILEFDTESMEFTRLLRPSDWKWEVLRLPPLQEDETEVLGLTRWSIDENTFYVASEIKTPYFRTINVLDGETVVYRDDDHTYARDLRGAGVSWERRFTQAHPLSGSAILLSPTGWRLDRFEKLDLRGLRTIGQWQIDPDQFSGPPRSTILSVAESSDGTIHVLLFHSEAMWLVQLLDEGRVVVRRSNAFEVERRKMVSGRFPHSLPFVKDAKFVRVCRFPQILDIAP